MKQGRAVMVVGAALALTTTSAAGQVGWESPLLAAPAQQAELGVFLTDMAGGDLGVMGMWRGGDGSLGLRVGLADDARDEIAVFGGVDYQRPLIRHSADFPLDVEWVLGAGLSIGDRTIVSIPAGLTVGRLLPAEGVDFKPYVTPRLVVDLGENVGGLDDDSDLDLVADIGLDFQFQPGWRIRFGIALGDRGDEAIAIGIAF